MSKKVKLGASITSQDKLILDRLTKELNLRPPNQRVKDESG